jgi:hypothetical protein
VFICVNLCGPIQEQPELDVAEIRQFAEATARISQDEEALKRLLAAVESEDAASFRELVKQLQLERFCHQLCHWLCFVGCRLICNRLCLFPLITEVSYIPTGQIDAMGYGSGPSIPPGTTPPDNKPAGVGDHPFGGIANIRGFFGIPDPYQYKLELATSPAGPWTSITTPITD